MITILVQLILALIMFAVGLEMKLSDIKGQVRVLPVLAGVSMQWVLLPLLVMGYLIVINARAELAIALLLLAACPGGNLSNFFTARSGGLVGLSVALSFISSILAPLMVPLIFHTATQAQPAWLELYQQVSLSWTEMAQALVLSLMLPLILALSLPRLFPRWVPALEKFRKLSPVFLIILVLGAAWSFRKTITQMDPTLFIHVIFVSQFVWMAVFGLTWLIKRKYPLAVTLAWEVSTQNAAMAMVLGLMFFPNIPEVSLVGAAWGVWQMGVGLAIVWGLGKWRAAYA